MKKKKNKIFVGLVKLYAVFVLAFWLPHFAFAEVNTLQDALNLFIDFNVKLLIPLAFSAGVLFFMWRGAIYIFKSGSEEGKSEGRRVLMWGVITLFVMASIWGIIKFAQEDAIGITPPLELPPKNRTNSR